LLRSGRDDVTCVDSLTRDGFKEIQILLPQDFSGQGFLKVDVFHVFRGVDEKLVVEGDDLSACCGQAFILAVDQIDGTWVANAGIDPAS